MLHSMTGFGRAEKMLGDFQCVVEIKSLNGKQIEVYTKIPPSLKPMEIEMRGLIKKKLVRGSAELTIALKKHGASKPMEVNQELLKYYHSNILKIADDLNLEKENLLSTLVRLPEVVGTPTDTLSAEEKKAILDTLSIACDALNNQRKTEGVMMENTLSKNISAIEKNSTASEPFEIERKENQRKKLEQGMENFSKEAQIDKNRFEQELIYYIEKLDVSEEKTRLAHHCTYFKEILATDDFAKGKKLGFILQEIGREINTLGAKANHAKIQKLVVEMKDELEQAKEQVLNAL